jgi:hypothetical protein
LGTDWTRNQSVWNNFKQQLLEITNLKNIHFMGGETLLTDRFEDLVDTMIEHKRFDLCFSFVSNGTVFRPELLDKLKQFTRVGIEISVETVDEHNAYQRQGTDTTLVLNNVQRYLDHCNGTSITVTLRPAVSILTIGYYAGLLQYALDHKLIVKGLLCYNPRFLNAEILPTKIKQLYLERFQPLANHLANVEVDSDYNASDPNNYQRSIKEQVNMCLNVLNTTTTADSQEQLALMVRHCERWDRVYGYDARQLYPEFQEILTNNNYDISS